MNKYSPFILLLMFCLFGFSGDLMAQRQKKNKSSVSPPVADIDKSTYYFLEGEKYFILEDYAKAFVLFQKAAEYDPNNGAARFKLAGILIQNGELDKALVHAQEALKQDPQNKFYYLINAEIFTKQGNFDAAAEVYKSMMANVEESEIYLYDLAALYLYQKDLRSALEVYDEAENKFGMNPEVIFQKQKIYLKLNELDKAIEEGEKLIAAYPGEKEFVLQLVEVLLANNRYDQAESQLKKLLAIDDNDAHARLLLAEVYNQTGNETAARESLLIAFSSPDIDLTPKLQLMSGYISQLTSDEEKEFAAKLSKAIIEAHPGEANAYAIAGDMYFYLDEKQEAINYYLQALEFEKDNFGIWQNVLDLELRLNQLDSVILHADQALEYFPNQAALYYFSGTANLIKKQYQEAADVLEQGKMVAAGNNQLLVIFHAQLGDAYNGLKQYERSDAAYEAALKLDPKNSHVLNNYAYFLSLRKENLDKAIKMSSHLVEVHPDEATYLDTHAWVLYMRGEYKEAKKFLERAIVDTESGVIIEHYGDVLFKLGYTEEAVLQWKRAKGMDDTSEVIDKKIADRKLYEE
jgi:tetratricopeptide (TPR) repeat protein